MARTFDGVDDSLVFSLGNLTGFNTDTESYALIIKRSELNTLQTVMSVTTAGFPAVYLSFDSSNRMLLEGGTFSIGSIAHTNTSDWIVVGWSKGAGTVAARLHTTTSGAWQHENTAGTVANGSGTVTGMSLGAMNFNGSSYSDWSGVNIYCAAAWNRVLSDSEFESLATNLAAWSSLSPSGLWVLNQAAVTTPVEDQVGTADETARVGTTVTTDPTFPLIQSGGVIAKVADRASAASNAAVTTVDLVLTGLTVDNYLIIRTAADNSGGGGSARNLSVSNQSGTPIDVAGAGSAQTNRDPGAASAGTTANLIWAKITGTSGTVRLTYSGSVVQACVAEEWSGINTTTPVRVAATGTSGSASGPTVGFNSHLSGDLLYAMLATEGPHSDTHTADADTLEGSWVSLTALGTTNATADTNQKVAGGYKLPTGTSNQSWSPTITVRDYATIGVSFAKGIPTSTLAVADSAHDHTADAAGALTQVHNLTVSEPAHTHAADSVVLSQAHELTVTDSVHAHAADNVALVQVHELTVADSVHDHTVEPVTLTSPSVAGYAMGYTGGYAPPSAELVIQDSVHEHVVDTVVVVGNSSLVVSDATHSHAASNVALTQGHVLIGVADAFHGHAVESVALTQQHTITVGEATHSHASETPALSQVHALTAAEASHGHASDNVSLTQTHEMVIADVVHENFAESPTIVQDHVLAVSDVNHSHAVLSAVLTQDHTLVPSDTDNSHTSDNASLTQDHTVVVDDAFNDHSTENVVLTLTPTLTTSDSFHTHLVESAALTQVHSLSVDDALHSHTSESSAITKQSILEGVPDSAHTHTADHLILSQQHVLTAADTAHAHSADSPGLSVSVTLSVSDSFHGHVGGGGGGGTSALPAFTVNGNWTTPRAWTVQDYSAIDEPFSSPDGSVITGPLSAGGDTSFTLADMPADFVTADSLSIRVRYKVANRVDDLFTLFARVVDGSGNALATGSYSGGFELLASPTSSAFLDSGAISFTTVNTTATKAQWDSAVLVFRQGYAAINTPDGFAAVQIDAVELTGAYVAAGEIVLTQVHNLSADDSAHAHTADSVATTQVHSLVAQDISHEHSSESVSLTQGHVLSVQDSFHSHSTDSASLTQQHTIVVNDSDHSHDVESPTLVQQHVLLGNDSSHNHTVGSVNLHVEGDLGPFDSTHSHVVDSVALSQEHSLAIADASHAHGSDEAALVVDLATLDSSHEHTVDGVALSQAHLLTGEGASHGHVVDNVVLTAQDTLSVADAFHDHAVESTGLTQDHVLATDDSTQLHSVDDPVLTQDHSLVDVADASHEHHTENIELTGEAVLEPADSSLAHSADSPTLGQQHVLVLDEVSHSHGSSSPTLFQEQYLDVVEVVHIHVADTPMLYPVPAAGVILNNAVALYLGSTPVEKVYLGSDQVWP